MLPHLSGFLKFQGQGGKEGKDEGRGELGNRSICAKREK